MPFLPQLESYYMKKLHLETSGAIYLDFVILRMILLSRTWHVYRAAELY